MPNRHADKNGNFGYNQLPGHMIKEVFLSEKVLSRMLHTKKNCIAAKFRTKLCIAISIARGFIREIDLQKIVLKNICVLSRFTLSEHAYQNSRLSMFIEILGTYHYRRTEV